MTTADVPEARRIFQVAFGTFMNAPDPAHYGADRDLISARREAAPENAWVAESQGRVIGSNLLTQWGRFGFFGPLTILPDFWGQGVAPALLTRTMARFEELGVREAALFTFSHSPKHIRLYQKFGFWPRSLTALTTATAQAATVAGASLFSTLAAGGQRQALAECRAVTEAIYPGLDVSLEVEAIAGKALGETVLVRDDRGGLEAFACCHCGPGTEAGKDAVYIKFAAVRPGPAAAANLGRLLAAVRDLAASRQLGGVIAGISLARREAYRHLLTSGFRIQTLGVSMHRPDADAYNQPGAWVLDDWR